jgi:hypothetical protein
MKPSIHEKYSEEYDAFYNEETNEWIEDTCDEPDCQYCTTRPERPLDENYHTGLRKGAEALAREIDRELMELLNAPRNKIGR